MNIMTIYKQFANKDIVKLIKPNYIQKNLNGISPATESAKNQIKLQVINNSAAYVAFKATNYKTKYKINNQKHIIDAYYNTQLGSDHAVAIIGWDDNITLNVNGTTKKGAWICLNSWGNMRSDGFIYVMYDDVSIYHLFGVYIDKTEIDSNLTMTKSTSKVYNYYKNYAKANFENFEITRLKQGNMFYLGEKVDIEFNSEVNTNTLKIEIFDGDKLSNAISFEKSISSIKFTADNLEEGCYKIKISYDREQDGIIDEITIKQIFMTSGIIFDGMASKMYIPPLPWVKPNDDIGQQTELGKNESKFVQGYSTQSIKFKNAYSAIYYSRSNQILSYLFIGSYSNITKIKVLRSEIDTKDPLTVGTITYCTENSYSTGLCNISGYTNYSDFAVGSTKVITLEITNINGYTKHIYFHLICTEENKKDDIIHINYLTNINNVVDSPKIAYFGTNNITTILQIILI